jgi:hypothetical protein
MKSEAGAWEYNLVTLSLVLQVGRWKLIDWTDGPNWVGLSCLIHLRTEIDPVSETLWFFCLIYTRRWIESKLNLIVLYSIHCRQNPLKSTLSSSRINIIWHPAVLICTFLQMSKTRIHLLEADRVWFSMFKEYKKTMTYEEENNSIQTWIFYLSIDSNRFIKFLSN